MRYFLIIFLFTFCLRTNAQANDILDQDPSLNLKASISIDGLPFEQALSKISTHCRINLSASNEVSNDIIVLFTHDLPLKSIMRKIASHFHFDWKRSGTSPNYSYKLYQSAKEVEDEKLLREKSLIEKIAPYRKSVQIYNNYLIQSPEILEKKAYENFKLAIAEKNPYKSRELFIKADMQRACVTIKGRMIFSILAKLTDRQWIQIAQGKALTFSTYPMYSDLPLPIEYRNLAQRSVNRQYWLAMKRLGLTRTALAKYIHKLNKKPFSMNDYVQSETPDGLPLPNDRGILITDLNIQQIKVKYFRLQIKQITDNNFLTCEGIIYNKKGELIEGPQMTIEIPFNMQKDFGQASYGYEELPNYPTKITAKLDKAYQRIYPIIEKESKQRADLSVQNNLTIKPFSLLSDYDMSIHKPPYNALAIEANYFRTIHLFQHVMASIQDSDPLSWFYGSYLGQISADTQLNIISDGFDFYGSSCLLYMPLSFNTELLVGGQLAQVLNKFRDTLHTDVSIENSWINIRAEDHSLQRAQQIPRQLLRYWAEVLQKEKYLDLYNLARLSTSFTDEHFEDRKNYLNTLILGNRYFYNAGSYVTDSESRYLLELLAILSKTQIENLLQGKTLGFASLNQDEQQKLLELVSVLHEQTPFGLFYSENSKRNGSAGQKLPAIRLQKYHLPSYLQSVIHDNSILWQDCISDYEYNEIIKSGREYGQFEWIRKLEGSLRYDKAVLQSFDFKIIMPYGGERSVEIRTVQVGLKK